MVRGARARGVEASGLGCCAGELGAGGRGVWAQRSVPREAGHGNGDACAGLGMPVRVANL